MALGEQDLLLDSRVVDRANFIHSITPPPPSREILPILDTDLLIHQDENGGSLPTRSPHEH